jgi:hypothetical protein
MKIIYQLPKVHYTNILLYNTSHSTLFRANPDKLKSLLTTVPTVLLFSAPPYFRIDVAVPYVNGEETIWNIAYIL